MLYNSNYCYPYILLFLSICCCEFPLVSNISLVFLCSRLFASVGKADDRSSIIAPVIHGYAYKTHRTMEVLIHEASSGQVISASQRPTCCTVDLKSSFKTKQEDVEAPSQIKHKVDKESVDIIFENITYTVNLGFRKGISLLIFSDTDTFLKEIFLFDYYFLKSDVFYAKFFDAYLVKNILEI